MQATVTPAAKQQTAQAQAITEIRKERCRRSFCYFLQYWQFVNRENGQILSFQNLWRGQKQLADLMESTPWIIALKAGKLGFTELECAYDGWVVLFRHANARVHLFSKDQRASMENLEIVRFGLTHLPDWLKPEFLEREPGGDNATSLKFRIAADDVRTIVSYPANQNVSINQSATHVHIDELAHMQFDEHVWGAVQTTVAPDGSLHIVSRGHGDYGQMAKLWQAAQQSGSRLRPHFSPWTARPDRNREWYDQQTMELTTLQLGYFAPETPEEALSGEEASQFVPMEWWDRCYDSSLPLYFDPQTYGLQGSKVPLVIGVDAATTGDHFAIVAVTRHPQRNQDVVVRAVRLWTPPPYGGQIEYKGPEAFLRTLVVGGCGLGHPYTPDHKQIDQRFKTGECPACRDGAFHQGYNVVMITFDPFQLTDMMQTLNRELGVWKREFSQQRERLISDKLLRDLIVNKRIWHACNPDDFNNPLRPLRHHIGNAAAKIPKDEENKLRIVKKSPDRKVDLVVALSMATSECLRLNI